MIFKHEDNGIYLYNDLNEICAGIEFPPISENLVNVNRTFVNEEMQGQGIAGKLMNELVESLRKTNRKAIPTCSYAVKWFDKHPEYNDLISSK